MGFVSSPGKPGIQGPPGPGGEAGSITIGTPHNSQAARFQLAPKRPNDFGVDPDYNWDPGDTATVDGITYTFVANLDETYPFVTITANTQPSDGDTITLGSITYRFKNTLSQAYDILIGTDVNDTMLNLRDGIMTNNQSTMFYDNTVVQNPEVYGYAEYTIGAPTIVDGTIRPIAKLIGVAGNALNIPATTTSSAITISSPTFTGGTTNTQPNQVKIITEGSWLSGTMYNLQYAVTGQYTGLGIEGVMFSSGTQTSSRFTSTSVAPMDFTAKDVGSEYNDLEVTLSRSDLFEDLTVMAVGLDATPCTIGDIRLTPDANGIGIMYIAAFTTSDPKAAPWRQVSLNGF